jgi:glutamate--cysteine ligase catalytic subunit
VELSVQDILEGKRDSFPGLIPLVEAYLDAIKCDDESRSKTKRYIDLLRKRASGELLTAAGWMRKFVSSHSAYKKNSILSDETVYDLLQTIAQLGRQEVKVRLGTLQGFAKHLFSC